MAPSAGELNDTLISAAFSLAGEPEPPSLESPASYPLALTSYYDFTHDDLARFGIVVSDDRSSKRAPLGVPWRVHAHIY